MKQMRVKCIVTILIVALVIIPSACKAPAAFEVTSLNITPAEAGLGELVTVTAVVENTGDVEGTYTASLTIDEIEVKRQEIWLGPKMTRTVAFDIGEEEAGLYYAQSYSLVNFLIHDYGKDRMLQLLSVFKEGSAHDDALLEVYGFDTDGLDDLWCQSLELESRTSSTFPHRGVASLVVLTTVAECMR